MVAGGFWSFNWMFLKQIHGFPKKRDPWCDVRGALNNTWVVLIQDQVFFTTAKRDNMR